MEINRKFTTERLDAFGKKVLRSVKKVLKKVLKVLKNFLEVFISTLPNVRRLYSHQPSCREEG